MNRRRLFSVEFSVSRERRLEYVAAVVVFCVMLGVWYAVKVAAGAAPAAIVVYLMAAVVLVRRQQLLRLFGRLSRSA